MSAETLRRAASLMRERASAATSSPWNCDLNWSPSVDQDGRGRASIVGDRPIRSRLVVEEAAVDAADAAHIASWHPAVALAVADWLDEVAYRSEQYPKQYRAAKHALAVARAYLGEDV